jgi:hypothetical protein
MMEELKVADFVKENNRVYFSRYRKGYFYYLVKKLKDMQYYEFPVPMEDIGDGTMLASDKALTFIKHIQNAIQDKTLVKYLDEIF